MISRLRSCEVLLGIFLEDHDDDALAHAQPLRRELRGEGGLAASRGATEQQGIAGWNAAPHHLIEPRHSRGEPHCSRCSALGVLLGDARKDLYPRVRNPERMQAGHRGSAPNLHRLKLSHHRVASGHLRHPEHAVGRRIRGTSSLLLVRVADEERRHLPRHEMQREPLHEVLDGHSGIVTSGRDSPEHRPKRVDHHESRLGALDLVHDALEHDAQIPLECLVAQVHVADRRAKHRRIEEIELLLIPQQLDRGLAEHGEEERGTRGGRVREHDLLGERRLPGACVPGDQVEGIFGEPAPQHRVEAWHTRVHRRNSAIRCELVRILRGLSNRHRAPSFTFASGIVRGATSPTTILIPTNRPRSASSVSSSVSSSSAVAVLSPRFAIEFTGTPAWRCS